MNRPGRNYRGETITGNEVVPSAPALFALKTDVIQVRQWLTDISDDPNSDNALMGVYDPYAADITGRLATAFSAPPSVAGRYPRTAPAPALPLHGVRQPFGHGPPVGSADEQTAQELPLLPHTGRLGGRKPGEDGVAVLGNQNLQGDGQVPIRHGRQAHLQGSCGHRPQGREDSPFKVISILRRHSLLLYVAKDLAERYGFGMTASSRFMIAATFAAGAVILTLTSCATVAPPPDESSAGPVEVAEGGLTATQAALVDAAHWAQGRSDVSNNGRNFSMDCSGVVSALYWRAGIDLQSCYPRYTGNGVARIYRWMEDEKLLYRPDEPAPGDLIFWDNSYDKNGNGAADDDLTHIGMAVSVDREGLVTYVHLDYISGVVFAKMYPPDPADRTRNTGMRMRSLGPTPDGGMTSGDLYRQAARGWELAE